MKVLQFPTITAVTLGCFLVSCVPTPRTPTVTIDLPKQEETIKTSQYNDMQGKYVGEIPAGYKLFVLAQDDFNYYLMSPPPSVDKNTKSWSQTNVSLTTPGKWKLHVFLADKTASEQLETKITNEDFSGFKILPGQMESVQNVDVNRK
jgi:hypothetical protein